MIIIIDNYDSFTYNLYQYLGEFITEIEVYRNDKITAEEIRKKNPDGVVLSPGPKDPCNAGNCLEIINSLAGEIPILGICLGHQCIGQAFGGKIVHAKDLYHGKKSHIDHNRKGIFENISTPLEVGRYHSLVIEKDSLPPCLKITATSEDGEIMGIEHEKYSITGLQFHPESILTREGKKLIQNFIEKERIVC